MAIDINIDLIITGVPDKTTADKIAADIRAVLNEKHGTDILVTWEDITAEDTGDHA